MKFPTNSPNMVVIPSNKKGTGFLKTTYDPRYLVGIMKEDEFIFIIDTASKLNAKAYSDKRVNDNLGIPKIYIWLMILSYLLTLGVFIILYIFISSSDENELLLEMGYAFLCASIIIILSVMVSNCRQKNT